MLKPKKINKNDLQTNVEDYELVEIESHNILIYPDGRCFVIFEHEDKQLAYALTSAESTMLIYARTGCMDHSHIKTIYQIFMHTLTITGCKLLYISIDNKIGDMYYARMCWEDYNKRKFYNPCNVADALICATLSECPIKITKFVLQEMEDLSTVNFQEQINDY